MKRCLKAKGKIRKANVKGGELIKGKREIVLQSQSFRRKGNDGARWWISRGRIRGREAGSEN